MQIKIQIRILYKNLFIAALSNLKSVFDNKQYIAFNHEHSYIEQQFYSKFHKLK